MRFLLEIPSSCQLLIPVSANSGALMQALAESSIIRPSGYGKDRTYEDVTAEQPLEIKIVTDDFTLTKPEPIKKAVDEAAAAVTRWCEEYNKRARAELALTKMKEQLAKRGITLTPDEPTTTS